MIEIPVLPPPEDRTYLPFIATALMFALGAGFALAVLLPLTATGHLDWATRYSAMVQAHGAVQLQGFAGLSLPAWGSVLCRASPGPALRGRFSRGRSSHH